MGNNGGMKLSFLWVLAAALLPAAGIEYRVLATTKTSTMEREMNQAAADGFVFSSTMGGETAVGGNEVVAVMSKQGKGRKLSYRLLATNKTSTMEKELNEAGAEGFSYVGQTIFNSGFGGREVSVILEKDAANSGKSVQYKIVATSKTSTFQKELSEAGAAGFQLMGITVAKTSFGGNELVAILLK